MTQPPDARERIESLWDRATPVGPLLDAYRDGIVLDMGQDLIRGGLRPFLDRLVGERNTELLLGAVRDAVLRNDAYRAAVLREAADHFEQVAGDMTRFRGSQIAAELRRLADEGPRRTGAS